MNAKQLYLAWVRTNHPQVYGQALHVALSPRSGMGGLGDDLTDSLTGTGVDFSTTVTGLSDADAASLAASADQSTAQGSSWGDLFNSIANAVTTVAPVIVQTQAQQNLLQINTQRARQGLPPLTANGVPVSASQLAPANPTMARLESSLSGGGGLALAGIAALFVGLMVLGGRRHA